MEPNWKRCTKCGEVKVLDDFYAMKGMKDGHRNECKACNLAAKKARYEADPQSHIDRVTRWQRANKERHLAYQRDRRSSPEIRRRERDGHLRRKFGITADEYDRLLDEQDGGCAICGRPPRPDISLHVDHDHETGTVRGLLCFPCNQSLGLLGDHAHRCREAAGYLDRHDPVVRHEHELARARLAELLGR